MNFSKITLGTVQFGLNYGIANQSGQPGYQAVCQILQYSYEHGVTTLDTAAAYGTSEAVLGRALHELGLTNRFQIVTKIPPLPATCEQKIKEFMEHSLLRSLERLQCEQIAVCLLHREDDLPFLHLLEDFMEQGLVRGIGVSLDSTRFLDAVQGIKYFQVPVNMLDRRFEPLLAQAEHSNTIIFARSALLQGVLTMPETTLPVGLQPLCPYIQQLKAVASSGGISLVEMALRYTWGKKGVASLLTGIDTLVQLEDNLLLCSAGALPSEVVMAIERIVPELDEQLIRPSLWNTTADITTPRQRT